MMAPGRVPAPAGLALALLLVGSCTPTSDDVALHFEMTTVLAPGLETQRCMFLQLPATPIVLKRGQMSYTPGSHHVTLLATSYTSRPTRDLAGNTVDTSGVFECPHGGGDWETGRSIGASQSPEPVDIFDLPDGMGVRFPAGSLLLLNAHYINASETPREVRIFLDFWGIGRDEKVEEPGSLEFTNDYILVPPYGRSAVRMRCPVPRDLKLLEAQSHMHQRGTNFVVRLLDADGREVEELYRNADWDHVPIKHWKEGHPLAAGQWVDFECDYENPTERTLLNGQTTQDEMCTLRGSYFPYDEAFDLCLAAGSRTANSAAVIVGNGAKACGEVLPCFLSEKQPTNETGEGGAAYIACQQSTCPAVAAEVSDFLHCQQRVSVSECPACGDAPDGYKSEPCVACVRGKCAAEVAACDASRCP